MENSFKRWEFNEKPERTEEVSYVESERWRF